VTESINPCLLTPFDYFLVNEYLTFQQVVNWRGQPRRKQLVDRDPQVRKITLGFDGVWRYRSVVNRDAHRRCVEYSLLILYRFPESRLFFV
jgi:hypothetical protein